VRIGIVIEVDVGQHRCGVPPGPLAAQLLLDVQARAGLRVAGIQGYQGRLQSIPSYTARRDAVRAAMDALAQSLAAIHQAGLHPPVVTGGGTGSAPIDIELGMLTELQPGSYVTMDSAYAAAEWTPAQERIPFGQPLLVLASVVSRPSADRAVIDVGWKAISSDGGTPSVHGRADLQYEFAGDEHGIVRAAHGALTLRPGDRVCLAPTHCDTTVNLYDAFSVHRAGRLETRWTIEARGRSQ
jgi:D-serine deaminase-like pyridoxal phosphate-dependent protein